MEIKSLAAHPSNYTRGRAGKIEYIVVHYTANDGDSAQGNCRYFSAANRNASANYFVDENSVWQSVRDEDTAWHCGSATGNYKNSCRNYNSIGVELCSRRDARGQYYFKAETIARAAELIRQLMAKYKVPLERVVRHYDVTGKGCPAPFMDEGTWLSFKKRLEVRAMTYEQAIKRLVEKGVVESREYWDNAVRCVKYLDRLIINMAEKL